jgi:hypothetical protein
MCPKNKIGPENKTPLSQIYLGGKLPGEKSGLTNMTRRLYKKMTRMSIGELDSLAISTNIASAWKDLFIWRL